MKFRLNKVKLVILIFLITIIMIMNNNVFGYNLQIEAKADSLDSGLYFQTMAKAADINAQQWAAGNWLGKPIYKNDIDGWAYKVDNPDIAAFGPGKGGLKLWESYTYYFYNANNSVSNFGPGKQIGYLTNSQPISYINKGQNYITPSYDSYGYTTNSLAADSPEAMNTYNNSIKFPRQDIINAIKIVDSESGDGYTNSSPGIPLYLTEHYINGDTLKYLINTLNPLNNGGKIRYSMTTVTKTSSGSLYEMFYTNQFYNNPIVSWGNQTLGLTDSGRGSAMNEFDNIIQLPANLMPRKIYVRHIDATTGKLIEGIKNTESLDYPPFPAGVSDKAGFSEYYEIPMTKAITLGKYFRNYIDTPSGTKTLEHLGIKYSTKLDFNTALSNINTINFYNGGKDEITLASSNQQDYTIVDFYYNIGNLPPENGVEGDLTFDPVDPKEPGFAKTEKDVYVPTTTTLVGGVENAYPFLLKDFSYKTITEHIDIGNGEIVTVKYCRVERIDLFTIQKAILHDLTTNEGGKLFNIGDDITLNVSTSYSDRSSVIRTPGVLRVEDNPNTGKKMVIVSNDKVEINGQVLLFDKTTTITSGSKVDLSGGYDDKMKYLSNPDLDNKDVVTTTKDFANQMVVPKEYVNGTRNPFVTIYYVTMSNKYLDSKTLISFDTPYYKESTIVKEFSGPGVNDKVTILNPIKMLDPEIKSVNTVNHSDGTNSSAVLQRNAEFTITPKTTTSSVAGYKNVATDKFVDHYLVKFDFDATGVRIINNATGKITNIGNLKALSIIKTENNNCSITGTTTNDFGETALGQISNKIRIIAVGINAPKKPNIEDFIYNFEVTNAFNATPAASDGLQDNNEIIMRTLKTKQNELGFLTRTVNFKPTDDLLNASYHAVRKDSATNNLGRIYDFKVTDCLDVNFKPIFRLTNSNNVNVSTNKAYYAGINYWNTNTLREVVRRSEADIGVSPLRILPLGPYKNNSSYINAPKLGYRISFDLKTNGYMSQEDMKNNKRTVKIKPIYYYISKAGGTPDFNIKLMYKNSSGTYIPFENSNYTIYFKPDDGYRNIMNKAITGETGLMSKNLLPLVLGSTNGFTLNYQMMNYSNNGYIQSWYGEYKLPNSTIVCAKNADGTANMKAQKSDGYVGVIFNIEAIDNSNGKITKVSYNVNDSSLAPNNTNTTQWDYEGSLGFSRPGNPVQDTGLRLQLEKGIWTITNAIYSGDGTNPGIKGSVVLYDLDARASDDFQ